MEALAKNTEIESTGFNVTPPSPPIGVKTYYCKKCDTYKPTTEFYDSCTTRCKACKAVYQVERARKIKQAAAHKVPPIIQFATYQGPDTNKDYICSTFTPATSAYQRDNEWYVSLKMSDYAMLLKNVTVPA